MSARAGSGLRIRCFSVQLKHEREPSSLPAAHVSDRRRNMLRIAGLRCRPGRGAAERRLEQLVSFVSA